jgi:hypothetical protein
VTKNTPTPFERIRRTVWATWSRNASDALRADEPRDELDLRAERLVRVAEQEVRLVEEEDELRFVRVADLGQ